MSVASVVAGDVEVNVNVAVGIMVATDAFAGVDAVVVVLDAVIGLGVVDFVVVIDAVMGIGVVDVVSGAVGAIGIGVVDVVVVEDNVTSTGDDVTNGLDAVLSAVVCSVGLSSVVVVVVVVVVVFDSSADPGLLSPQPDPDSSSPTAVVVLSMGVVDDVDVTVIPTVDDAGHVGVGLLLVVVICCTGQYVVGLAVVGLGTGVACLLYSYFAYFKLFCALFWLLWHIN